MEFAFCHVVCTAEVGFFSPFWQCVIVIIVHSDNCKCRVVFVVEFMVVVYMHYSCSGIQGGPKSKPLVNYQKIALKPASKIRFIRHIKVSSTILSSISIKYSVRGLLCDVINYACLQSSDVSHIR